MNCKTSIDKIIKIYKRSELSISKFASIIGKDRRTLSSWIDKVTTKEPSSDVKERISSFFRYPIEIWDENCEDMAFEKLISEIPKQEIKIIDEGYLGGLQYILNQEDKERLVIHPQFPGPVYRDSIVPKVYRGSGSSDAEKIKVLRTQKMLVHSFATTEWYSIKSLLSFCFSQIGVYYTLEQKIQVFDLMINVFKNNYNKRLYFYDSYSRKIYGLDTTYISINIKKEIMFFKAPLESVFIEIRNVKLINQFHKYFTDKTEAPSHVNSSEASHILEILKTCLLKQCGIIESYEVLNKETNYGGLFLNSLSIDLQRKVSKPKDGQKRN